MKKIFLLKKGKNPLTGMSTLEGSINQLVDSRQLYGTPEDEVKIVEGKA